MVRESEFTIGELAKATETHAETVRYYERVGLLRAPRRTTGNYRVYASKDAERLAFIRRGRNLGFTIDEIRTLLALAEENDRDCGAVDALAREHLAAIECKIRDLKRLATELRHLICQCHGGSVSECRIIEGLTPNEVPTPAARVVRGQDPGRRRLR